MGETPTIDFWTEQRRQKHARSKKKIQDFDRPAHLKIVGANTRFKKGQHVGRLSPRWKGGRYVRYGLTPERYDEIVAIQGGLCAICLKPPGKRRLQVDHDHKTGRVRGLVCFRCNYGMGWFQEDLERLKRIESYLTSGKDWRCLP